MTVIGAAVTVAVVIAGCVGNVNKATVAADVNNGSNLIISNPYKEVDWNTYKHHKAALHIHTVQSDGLYTVPDVVNTYRKAGYTIMSITDHDWSAPNNRIRRGKEPKPKASVYPEANVPMDLTYPFTDTPYVQDIRKRIPNFPANPTWPWTDYGCPSPHELGMVGIEGSELSYRHHINSYFNNYGIWYEGVGTEYKYRVGGYNVPFGGIFDSNGNEVWEDDQLNAVAGKGGLAILNHPGIVNSHWWMRQSLQWYVERYSQHSSGCLIGIEVTNCPTKLEPYDEGLWDQLLARFMPDRPVWGFGDDDMHDLENSPRETFNVFVLSENTPANIRRAMEHGQFYFCKSTERINYLAETVRLGVFPKIKNIEVNQRAGIITISAVDCDEIKWISSPGSLVPTADYNTSNNPWPLGKVVHTGPTLNCLTTPGIKNYVRAELVRKEGERIYRTFTNPFGINSTGF